MSVRGWMRQRGAVPGPATLALAPVLALALGGCHAGAAARDAAATMIGPDPDQQAADARAPAPDAAAPGDDAGTADGPPPPTPSTVQPCRLLGLGTTTSMDVSADGKLAVFGNSAGGVTLMALPLLVAVRTITAHAAGVTAVAFTADSSRVASGDSQGNVALWGVADGAPVWTAALGAGAIQALLFSPAGRLWAQTAAGLVPIDAATGAAQAVAPGTAASASALSPDGRTLVLGGTDGSFRLVDAAGLATSTTVAGAHPGGVTALRVSANGMRIASGGADGTTALWDLQGNLLARVARPGMPPASVDLDATGSILAANAHHLEYTFKLDGTLLGSDGPFPTYSRLTSDGAYVVSMTDVARADVTTVDPTKLRYQIWDDMVSGLAFAPDGVLLADSRFDDVHLWNTQTGEMVRVLDTTPPATTPAPALAFSPDGTMLARNAYNPGVYLFRVADGALLASYTGNVSSASLAFSPDGQWLATTGATAAVLWRVADGSSGPASFVAPAGARPSALTFSADGKTLFLGDSNGGVSLWSFPGGASIATFPALLQAVRRIAVGADGSRVVVADGDGNQALFTPDGRRVATLARAPSFALSADGTLLAAVNQGPPVRHADGLLYNQYEVVISSAATGLPLMGIVPASPDDATLYFGGGLLAFAGTGHRLAVADMVIRVFCLP